MINSNTWSLDYLFYPTQSQPNLSIAPFGQNPSENKTTKTTEQIEINKNDMKRDEQILKFLSPHQTAYIGKRRPRKSENREQQEKKGQTASSRNRPLEDI